MEQYTMPTDKIEFMKESIEKLKAENKDDYEAGEFDSFNHKYEGRYKAFEEVLQWLNPATQPPSAPAVGGMPELKEPILSEEDMEEWQKENSAPVVEEGYLMFENLARDWWRECYGKEFPYKFSDWAWNKLKAASITQGAVTKDAHEKEVMMKAFDKVRQIFESRSWIMEGRGSYPYNDDRYKEEVRYMYDEFDALFKDTWANIDSKSFEYRQRIISEYLKETGSQRQQAGDE